VSDGTIKVTFAEIQQASQDITTSANTVEQHLNDLKGKIAPIVAEWTGDASSAYQDAQRRWDQAAADFQSTLQAIGIAVRQAAEGYQDAEGSAKKLWG
jgi:early secretory antigenic target protein ESAT-6